MEIIYNNVTSWENVHRAWKKAAKGKRSRASTAAFEFKLEEQVLELQSEMQSKTYTPGSYTSFYIHEPKKRLISAAPFRDRVVHHALCQIIEPLFEKSFIFDSYANRIGRGTHRALDRAQMYSRQYRYVLQCDIEQFFPAIDHKILYSLLKKKIDDSDVLWLVKNIIDSGVGVLSEAYAMHYFPGDDLFAPLRHRGLPIGNLTSQFWANCFLNPFDHFIKRELRCPAYLRYVDDFLLFSNSKKQLWQWKIEIIQRLQKFRLTIHENKAHVRPVTEGLPFLGFVLFPTHRLLKRRKGVHFRRQLKAKLRAFYAGLITFQQLQDSILGWINHVSYGDTWGLRRALFSELKICFAEVR